MYFSEFVLNRSCPIQYYSYSLEKNGSVVAPVLVTLTTEDKKISIYTTDNSLAENYTLYIYAHFPNDPSQVVTASVNMNIQDKCMLSTITAYPIGISYYDITYPGSKVCAPLNWTQSIAGCPAIYYTPLHPENMTLPGYPWGFTTGMVSNI